MAFLTEATTLSVAGAKNRFDAVGALPADDDQSLAHALVFYQARVE